MTHTTTLVRGTEWVEVVTEEGSAIAKVYVNDAAKAKRMNVDDARHATRELLANGWKVATA